MPKWEVSLTKTLELVTSITVRAKTEEEAEEKALKLAQAYITWSIDDQQEWEEQDQNVQCDSIEQVV